LFAGINTLTVTYYLAIENIPSLKAVFPSFVEYIIIIVTVGIPLLVITGYAHFKRSKAYKSEQEVAIESNPWVYKLSPGHQKMVLFPNQLMMNTLLLKLLTNEKITEDEIKKMKELQKQINHLIGGGYVGNYRQKD